MPTILSERIINHPANLVYTAFSDPALLAKWWGPKGFTNRFEAFDLTPGGHWIFDMIDANGTVYPNHGVFQEVIPNKLVTWTRLSQPIFDMKVSFEDMGPRTCKIAFHMIFVDERLYETINSFAPEKNEENFDRLEELLARNS